MLTAVLARTAAKGRAGVYDGTRTVLHRGTITIGELRKAGGHVLTFFADKPDAKEAKVRISWRIWLGADKLVRRARAEWTQGGQRYVSDAHLSGWGARTEIKPPPPAELVKP
jgi:hypothetical protein